MGRKVHPLGFRLGYIKNWSANWYAERDYGKLLLEDLSLRRFVEKELRGSSLSKIDIERAASQLTITIHTGKPGIVIGRAGSRIDALRNALEKRVGRKVRINVQEVRRPELDAALVAQNIADQLEHRISYRRAMKQAVGRAMRFGAQGIKTKVSGRLGGAEMSRTEGEREGRVPLHTLRADIDYGTSEARTNMGKVGVKVWVYLGDVLPERSRAGVDDSMAQARARAEMV